MKKLFLALPLILASYAAAQMTFGSNSFPALYNTTFPQATVGTAYSFQPTGRGGFQPYTWAYYCQAPGNTPSCLPPGLSFDSGTGAVTGTPTTSGVYTFYVQITDQNGQFIAIQTSINVLSNVIPPLVITSCNLPLTGQVSVVYPTTTCTASGGQAPYSWASNPSVPCPGLLFSTAGTISGTPTTPGLCQFTVGVTDSLGSTANTPLFNLVISPLPPPTLTVTNNPCPGGTVGQFYQCALTATGGTPPYNCTLVSGSNPAGTNLASCLVSGTATTAQTVTPLYQIADSGSPPQMVPDPSVGTMNITIVNPSGGAGDNLYTPCASFLCTPSYTGAEPVSFPTRGINSLRANRPSGNTPVVVPNGANLQQYLTGPTHTVVCGDILDLTAGSTYTGVFTFPALTCPNSNWLTIRTQNWLTAGPPEGTRVTPCYDNIASLPGRTYTCPTPSAKMARIVSTSTGTGPIRLDTNNTSGVQFIGVSISAACTKPCNQGPLVGLPSLGHDYVFDQVIGHGQEMTTIPATSANFTETFRFAGFQQTHNIAAVDGYYYDFYCVAGNLGGNSGCDAQTFGTGTGTTANSGWGNWKIVNNYMEGAAETMENGGGAGPPCSSTCQDDSPGDYEIRLNHMAKPIQWMPTSQTAAGAGYPVVKNLLECKTCERMFVEGNIFENLWGGFTQSGYAFVINPKSQSSGSSNLCPNCTVSDVIIRYNRIKNSCAMIQLSNGNNDNGAFAFQGYNTSMHDNIADNMMSPNAYKCGTGGQLEYQINTPPSMNVLTDVLHNEWVQHNTTVIASPSIANFAGMIGVSGPLPGSSFQINHINFNSNLGSQGLSGTINTNGGGSINCAGASGVTAGISAINSCWNPNTFGGNAIVASTSIWGAGNCLSEPSYTSIFVNYNGGVNGDYHVKPTSPCHLFSDGGTTDPGANVDLVNTYTANSN